MLHITLILLLIVLCIYLYYKNNMIKIIRFYRPTCMYCRKTQREWNLFKQKCNIMVECIDINLDEAKSNGFYAAMIQNFEIKSVPTIVAVLKNGMRISYEGSRSTEDLLQWSSRL